LIGRNLCNAERLKNPGALDRIQVEGFHACISWLPEVFFTVWSLCDRSN
jgi:hypothetical protein